MKPSQNGYRRESHYSLHPLCHLPPQIQTPPTSGNSTPSQGTPPNPQTPLSHPYPSGQSAPSVNNHLQLPFQHLVQHSHLLNIHHQLGNVLFVTHQCSVHTRTSQSETELLLQIFLQGLHNLVYKPQCTIILFLSLLYLHLVLKSVESRHRQIEKPLLRLALLMKYNM